MIAAILFVISMAAFVQFGVYYWRACIAMSLRDTVSDRVLAAAGISGTHLGSRDFVTITKVHDVISAAAGGGGKLRMVRAYYLLVEKLERIVPSVTNWAEVEMAMCSHYVGVQADQLLERNLALHSPSHGM